MPSPEATYGLTLGTAGHIDHGKTRLVSALTGVDTDRLEEERRRGISIELGFAELKLPGGCRLGVVDVPGHEQLVRTMVAGASGIDLFLLVVAADDGVMPQTLEHASILRALGVEEGVVAVTKADVAPEDAIFATTEEVRRLVPEAAVVRVSAITGAGLGRLRDELAACAQREAMRKQAAPWPPEDPLLHIDRSFTITGAGTVVTGTVASGVFRAGDQVEVLPSGKRARLRGIQVHDEPRDTVSAGHRAALNLGGLGRHEAPRGSAVCAGEFRPFVTWRIAVRVPFDFLAGPRMPRRVQVHHGTRDVPARWVALADGFAQLRLERQLIARAGDRAVIRSISPPGTIAGVEIVDPYPPRSSGPRELDRLRILREGSAPDVLGRAFEEGDFDLDPKPARWRGDRRIAYALPRFAAVDWQRARERASPSVEAEGAEAAEGEKGDHVRRKSPSDSPTGRAVLALLRVDGSRPRSPRAIADELDLTEKSVASTLGELVRAGLAHRLAKDIYYASERLKQLQEAALAAVAQRGAITVAELRDQLGTSRKYSQAILEHLDRERVTIRRGDVHVLRRSRSRR